MKIKLNVTKKFIKMRIFKLKNEMYIKKNNMLFKKGSKFYEDKNIVSQFPDLIWGYFYIDKFKTDNYCLNSVLLKEIKPFKVLLKEWYTKEAETMNIFKAAFWAFSFASIIALLCGNVLAGLVNSLVSVFCYLFSARIIAIGKKEKEEIKKPYDIFNTIEKVEEKKPFFLRKYILKAKPWISGIVLKIISKLIDVSILYFVLKSFNLLK